MLDHAGEVATVCVGAWRFLLSPVYRRKKLDEWRGSRETLGGKLTMGIEILAALAIGVLLPLWLVLVVATNWYE